MDASSSLSAGATGSAGATVTTQVAERPFTVVAVTVAVPAATGVIVADAPSGVTVAIAALSTAHVTVLSVAFSGATVAVSLAEAPPTFNDNAG